MEIELRDWVYCGIMATALLMTLLLFFSRRRALREKRAAKQQLEDTLSSLEAVYSEVNTTQEELDAKYRELKASEEKIKKLAYEDNMTGLPNRAAFMEVLDHTMETLRKDEAVAIMNLDLDHFKKVNELWGNACGDELLLDISHRIKQNLEEDDYLARSASDEFLILSQNIGEIAGYEEKVKRIQKAFRFPFVLSVSEFTITISIGVVVGPRDGKTAGTLIKRADMALNQAKRLGKDTYCYYTSALEQKLLEDMEMRSDLTAAMKQSDFFLRYQPILLPRERACLGFRMELYWNRQEKGIWRASRFVRFAEETGQIIALGERAFRRICKDVKSWEELGIADYDMIVPLSKRQLLSPSLEQIICTVSKEEEVSLSRFLFEVNEKLLMSEYEECHALMEELSHKGFRFRLGDFGGGGMSLDCVHNLPVEQVALPVRRIFGKQEPEEAERYFQVITSALSMLGRSIVVTGISDAVEEQTIQQIIQTGVQGELYGESLSSEEVAAGWQKSVSFG